ncbi:hypothetical protein L3Q82_014557 [Scortum barcoo]|uniref:Uncharacterized protein n=1 Tax=Scortum barcoo TaxID=214431 RepID=A0ACB8VXA8_9TELE|nr:hypothetical protein L3Q82_014557 [Scortum barcoo]
MHICGLLEVILQGSGSAPPVPPCTKEEVSGPAAGLLPSYMASSTFDPTAAVFWSLVSQYNSKTSIMATADQLLKKMFSWIEQRENCAEQLRKLAQELETLRKKCNASECVGSSVSVVGAVCLIGAGVATFCTGGAAAPLLGVAGAVYSGVGAAISVVTKITEHFSSSDTMKEAKRIEEESNEIAEEIQELFKKLKAERKKVSPNADADDLDRHVTAELLGAMARRSGLNLHISFGMLDRLFLNVGPGNMILNQIFKFEVAAGLGGILSFFAFQTSGKQFKPFLDKGAQQLVKEISTTGLKTALKGGAMVVGGAVGLAFALPEAIDSWTDQIKNNHVTEASKSLKDTADTILKTLETLKKHFREIKYGVFCLLKFIKYKHPSVRGEGYSLCSLKGENSAKKTLQMLAEVKRCIENPNRNSEEKQKIIDFAIEMCEDETVREWLRENAHCLAFFALVNLFNFLKEELERRLSANRKEIDIIFVAHGGIEETFIPAGALLPLSTIVDVVLYSPWNCFIDAGIAYGISMGIIQPQHRDFFCVGENCTIRDVFHRPTNLPNCWNSMRASRGQLIPLITVSPVDTGEDVWKIFSNYFLGDINVGSNRIVIPFLLPGVPGPWPIPFFVITLVLSVVLWFSPFKATVHLAACLGKTYPGSTRYEDYLKQQYSCTINNTGMRPLGDMVINRHTNLYRALRAVFVPVGIKVCTQHGDLQCKKTEQLCFRAQGASGEFANLDVLWLLIFDHTAAVFWSLVSQEDSKTSIMATADQLLKKMFSWIEHRENCAEQLRKLAQELETLRKKFNSRKCVSSSVVGAVCLIGASMATFCIGGAAAPLLGVTAAPLLGGAAVYSGVGAAISMVTKITEHFSSSDTMKKAKRIEEESNKIAEEVQKLFKKLKAERKKVSPNADADDLDRHVTAELLGAMARRSGLNLHISRGMLDKLFLNVGPGNMILNQIFKFEVAAGLGGILSFFA